MIASKELLEDFASRDVTLTEEGRLLDTSPNARGLMDEEFANGKWGEPLSSVALWEIHDGNGVWTAEEFAELLATGKYD